MEITLLLYGLLFALMANAALLYRTRATVGHERLTAADAHVDCGAGRGCRSTWGACPFA